MSLETKSLDIVCPGTRVGLKSEYESGPGTYALGNYIYASLSGLLQHQNGIVSVVSPKSVSIVPENGAVVTCRVTRINIRMATVEILCVGEQLVQSPLTGVIRARDVRAFDIDSVEIYKCFRPGDIVRAIVLSRGDARNYYLSTAKNELGVLAAIGRAGVPMVPISWEQMQCPITKAKEYRKVAKQLFAQGLNLEQTQERADANETGEQSDTEDAANAQNDADNEDE